MVLTGTEIKSIREGRVSFHDTYAFFHQGELWVKHLHIAEYKMAGYTPHDPLRERKLLLSKKELKKWESRVREKGYAIIPTRLFISEKGLAKMEIGLGKGKKLADKRESTRERDVERDLRRKFH